MSSSKHTRQFTLLERTQAFLEVERAWNGRAELPMTTEHALGALNVIIEQSRGVDKVRQRAIKLREQIILRANPSEETTP